MFSRTNAPKSMSAKELMAVGQFSPVASTGISSYLFRVKMKKHTNQNQFFFFSSVLIKVDSRVGTVEKFLLFLCVAIGKQSSELFACLLGQALILPTTPTRRTLNKRMRNQEVIWKHFDSLCWRCPNVLENVLLRDLLLRDLLLHGCHGDRL